MGPASSKVREGDVICGLEGKGGGGKEGTFCIKQEKLPGGKGGEKKKISKIPAGAGFGGVAGGGGTKRSP